MPPIPPSPPMPPIPPRPPNPPIPPKPPMPPRGTPAPAEAEVEEAVAPVLDVEDVVAAAGYDDPALTDFTRCTVTPSSILYSTKVLSSLSIFPLNINLISSSGNPA